jgi:membrane protein YqaA with SNARE-associated domain
LLFTTVDLGCTILKFIFSLASKLGTYIPYLLSVSTCSKEKKRKEKKRKEKRRKKERKKFQAQALACLMFIILSFVFALCY